MSLADPGSRAEAKPHGDRVAAHADASRDRSLRDDDLGRRPSAGLAARGAEAGRARPIHAPELAVGDRQEVNRPAQRMSLEAWDDARRSGSHGRSHRLRLRHRRRRRRRRYRDRERLALVLDLARHGSVDVCADVVRTRRRRRERRRIREHAGHAPAVDQRASVRRLVSGLGRATGRSRLGEDRDRARQPDLPGNRDRHRYGRLWVRRRRDVDGLGLRRRLRGRRRLCLRGRTRRTRRQHACCGDARSDTDTT